MADTVLRDFPNTPTLKEVTGTETEGLDDSPKCVFKLDTTSESINDENLNPEQQEADYEVNPTKLYKYIEKKNWNRAIDRCMTHPLEAAVMIYRKEKSTHKLRWRQLPLHAALVFKAKTFVISELIKAYPQGVYTQDDQGMLPCHLAFRYNASETVINLLLEAYPESVNMKDKKGRIPIALTRVAEKKKSDGSSGQSVNLRTYIAHYHFITKNAISVEQKEIYTERMNGIVDNHNKEIEKMKQRVEHLQDCNLKSEAALESALKKLNSQEAEKVSNQNKNDEKDFEIKTMRLEMDGLRRQLKEQNEPEAKMEEKNKKIIDLVANSEANKNAHENKVAELESKIQSLTHSSNETQKSLEEKQNDLTEMTNASEILLERVKSLENELASQKMSYSILSAKLIAKDGKEDFLMDRITVLNDTLLNRSSEKKILMKKHAEEIRRLEYENAALRGYYRSVDDEQR